jgi:hypothetical protein
MTGKLTFAAAALAAAALFAPIDASARPGPHYGPPPGFHHHHHHYGPGLFAAGVLGVALGAAIASEPAPVYRPTVVYTPPAPVYVQQPVYVQPQPQVVYQQPV